MSKWQKTIKTAKQDSTLRMLGRAILASNAARDFDAAALCAFKDRCQEIGVTVPNVFYWSLLYASVGKAA